MSTREGITQCMKSIQPLLHLVLLMALLLVFTPVSFAAEVTNLNAKQEGNSIIFDFDVIAESSEQETEVMVVISVDGKELRDHQLHLEGDYGKVTVGKGKKITWNVLKDFPNGLGGDISWGVTAKRSAMTLNTEKDKLSYTFGANFGRSVRRQGIDVNPELVAKGLKDARSGAKLILSDEEILTIMMTFQSEMKANQAEKEQKTR